MNLHPEIAQAQVAWRSPSNIALVKYWGKYGNQLPCNASVSFTLTHAHTDMAIAYSPKNVNEQGVSLNFMFEGQENAKFAQKIQVFLESLLPIFPFLSQIHLNIRSSNSFPHSSGIASSASSMSALALCLCSIEQQLSKQIVPNEQFLRKASEIARLGSGSAARSVYPYAAVWGYHNNIAHSANEYAIPFAMHPYFNTYHNTILIVSRAEKSVSSRAGHALMNNHPYADTRYRQANAQLDNLAHILQTADVEGFIQIVENEALSLHGLMLNSTPSFILLHPNTLHIINQVRAFRQSTNIPVCFTLDAGPNVHLLYPAEFAQPIQQFIKTQLLHYCQDNYFIEDIVGSGAVAL